MTSLSYGKGRSKATQLNGVSECLTDANWRDLSWCRRACKGTSRARQLFPAPPTMDRSDRHSSSSKQSSSFTGERHPNQIISTFSVAEFLRDFWERGPTAQDSEALREDLGQALSSTPAFPVADFEDFREGLVAILAWICPNHPELVEIRETGGIICGSLMTCIRPSPLGLQITRLRIHRSGDSSLGHWIPRISLRIDPKISPTSDTLRAERNCSRSAEATD